MKKEHFVRRALRPLLIAVVVLLSGCSLLQSGLSGEDPRSELVTKAVVVSGTIRIIDGDAARRDEVVKIADTILQYMEKNPEGRAAEIGELVKDTIPWSKLTPEENYLVTTLLAVVQTDIEQKISEGAVSAETLLRVKAVVLWVKGAATSLTIPEENIDGPLVISASFPGGYGGLSALALLGRPVSFGYCDTWEDIGCGSGGISEGNGV